MSSQSSRNDYLRGIKQSASVNEQMMKEFDWRAFYNELVKDSSKYPAISRAEANNFINQRKTHSMVCLGTSTASVFGAYLLEKNLLTQKMARLAPRSQMGVRAGLYLGALYLGIKMSNVVHTHPKEQAFRLYMKAHDLKSFLSDQNPQEMTGSKNRTTAGQQ